MHMMLYDVVMMNMIYHVVCIVSTMSKDATRCTWCSMMNLDVGNVFIAFQGICRILWRFTPINAMWCSYCRYVCDAHIWKVPFSTSTYIDFSVNQVLDLCWTLDFWLDNNQSNLLDSFQYPLFLQLFSNYIVKKPTLALWLTHCCVSGDVCDLCF